MVARVKSDELKAAEDRLAKSERQLANLREEYREFISIVFHDLSGPLRHASSFSEMLLANNEDTLDDKSKKYLNIILDGAEYGKKDLDLLRQFSRVSFKDHNIVSDIDVSDMIDDILITLAPKINTSSAVVTYEDLPKITGDRDALKILFTALIDNALTFHTEGNRPKIFIEGKAVIDGWNFAVTDNGIGIPDHWMKNAFKVFKRNVNKSQYPGHGMGLAIAKKIVEKHEGHIWLDPGRTDGTKVSFTIASQG